MAGPTKPPPKGTGKPFLGDDDLNSELDAWDATFDALHEDASAPMPTEEVMAWPAAQAKSAPVTAPIPSAAELGAEPSRALDPPVFEPSEEALDEQMTLDRAVDDSDSLLDVEVEVPLSASLRPVLPDTYDSDPAETDFSDVGAQGKPAALGAMLGRHGTAPPVEELDDGRTRVDLKSGPTRRPPSDDDDDSVFTSASRPRAPAAPNDRSHEDPLAAPPPPTETPRRTPAIVRRTPLQVQPVRAGRAESQTTPPGGIPSSDFGELSEQTRIQDIGEIQAQADASRSSRHSTKTTPPPMYEEEDEYEVEIDASADAPEAAAPETVSRRTAHTVRRPDAPTRPPPMGHGIPFPADDDAGGGEVSMEVDDPDFGARSPEDDFSDVAAAVGASDESLDISLPTPPPMAPRRASTPELERSTGNKTLRPGLSPPINAPSENLEDALAGLDDEPVPQLADEGYDSVRQRARPTSVPPPAVADHYPRVKTPTSVPPLGQPANESAGSTLLGIASAQPAGAPQRLPSGIPLEIEEPAVEPELDVDAAVRAWPEQTDPLATTALDEAAAQALLVYERELATLDEAAASAALRIEAGRLSERLSDPDRARAHYDAALLADPRATAALRGLRRLARAAGDLVEAVQHLDAEIAVAGALERRPLGHYRIDLLMASNDQDLARVAVGETLDSAPSDVRALLAHLELAFLDGRADEFGAALEQLAHAVSDNELRAAVQSARGALAAHHNDTKGAASWFTAAAESDPTSLAARIGAIRQAAGAVDGPAVAKALLDLATQIEITDPLTAAAASVRAQQWSGGEGGAQAAALATATAPSDPLVARLAAETAAGGPNAVAAYAHWSMAGASPVERAYAA
ncbi:MAG: hypothetical protein H0T46_12210, partial [Deltaproteobacteria bacterium]|nr:hypothetical protein [Deltaproteobacteria bacterium]